MLSWLRHRIRGRSPGRNGGGWKYCRIAAGPASGASRGGRERMPAGNGCRTERKNFAPGCGGWLQDFRAAAAAVVPKAGADGADPRPGDCLSVFFLQNTITQLSGFEPAPFLQPLAAGGFLSDFLYQSGGRIYGVAAVRRCVMEADAPESGSADRPLAGMDPFPRQSVNGEETR